MNLYVLYLLFSHIAFLLALPFLLVSPKIRNGFLFRCGKLPRGWPGLQPGDVLWFHGASAGDLLALQPLINRVRRQRPGCKIVVTTVTDSGMKAAKEVIDGADVVGYAPFDLPWAVKRFVRAIGARVLVLECTEMWPTLIRMASKGGMRLVLVNGRFSPRRMAGYRFLYALIGSPLARFDALCMRDQSEAERAIELGADPERVRVVGNTKFDAAMLSREGREQKAASLSDSLGIEQGRMVLVAGSTHSGEHEAVLMVYKKLLEKYPGLKLIIAPRYLEQVSDVQRACNRMGLRCGLRSRGVEPGQVAILDTIGELRDAYGLASVVFVGGSLVRRGGHNLLEPAWCAKPVLFGPHTENCQEAVRLLQGRGGILVNDERHLLMVLERLLAEPAQLGHLGNLARTAVESGLGAVDACWEVIERFLGEAC
ncbi:MAG: 3-deoxy-D-manno-octulosonic acid transferase [Deltaproteobacteria bacterium]|nr:MAG: 3-deoxy-D-manno-octulosonic acid transferase [Deltaproteobacteria bacterium]